MEFKVNGTRYRVQFRLLVECRITNPVTGLSHAIGVSKCNPVDRFDWLTGSRLALARALGGMELTRTTDRAGAWQQFRYWIGLEKRPKTAKQTKATPRRDGSSMAVRRAIVNSASEELLASEDFF